MRAIDADAIAYESIDSSDTGRHEHYYGTGIIAVRKEDIDAMPTIQPEIVRCKDCKHHWTHKCMDSMPIERCDLEQTFYDAEVDFCSLAERREVTT